jgi:hypothetical protein
MKISLTNIPSLSLAVLALASTATHAATIITTDNFDYVSGYTAQTPWTTSGSATIGQWSLVKSSTNGRVAVDDNSLTYNPPTPWPSGTGYAQFNNGVSVDFAATITDTTAHSFTVGDQVAIDFYTAGRDYEAGSLSITVSLVGAATHNYGDFTPSSVTEWGQQTTAYFTIAVAGNYSVQFANVAESGDRTTYIDNVSYSVIPEPSSAALLGLTGLALLRRRRA